MDYLVCVPSYKRAETCKRKTLALLHQRKVPASRIIVYVADEAERALYAETLDPHTYWTIRVGKPGMGAIRNYITLDHPEGAALLMCDDDLDNIVLRVDDKTIIDCPDLDDLASRAFDLTKQVGLKLWGIYPVKNPMFMKPTVTGDLRYIEGAFWGILNRHDVLVTLDDKEDFERSIRRYIKDGGVLRFNFAAMITRFYTEPGGMQEQRTEVRVTESARYLAETYPSLAAMNTKKKSGHTELRLWDRAGLGIVKYVDVAKTGEWGYR